MYLTTVILVPTLKLISASRCTENFKYRQLRTCVSESNEMITLPTTHFFFSNHKHKFVPSKLFKAACSLLSKINHQFHCRSGIKSLSRIFSLTIAEGGIFDKVRYGYTDPPFVGTRS